MFTLEYADGWYIAKDGVGVIDFPNGLSEISFAQRVCDALNAAQQSAQRTATPAEKHQCSCDCPACYSCSYSD